MTNCKYVVTQNLDKSKTNFGLLMVEIPYHPQVGDRIDAMNVGDTISIILDTKKKLLLATINGGELKEMIRNIPIRSSIKYRLCVDLPDKGDSVSIIDFVADDVESDHDSKKRKLDVMDFTNIQMEQPANKKRKLNDDVKVQCDYKGVPEIFRKYKWLYMDCEELTDDGRQRIINFLSGKYMRNDVENEDILLKKVESIDGSKKVTKMTVFRMCFKVKKWKKVCISRKLAVAKK